MPRRTGWPRPAFTGVRFFSAGLTWLALSAPAPAQNSAQTVPDNPGSAPGSVPRPATAAAKDSAKEVFEQAMSLAQQGKYAAAKVLFLEAYRLLPHPIVAYNAALACVALGEQEQAADLLDRALQAGEGSVTPAERAAMQAARSKLAVPTSAAPTPEALDASSSTARAAPEGASGPSSPSSGETVSSDTSEERSSRPVLRRSTAPASALQTRTGAGSSTAGYIVGAAGAALLLGAGAIYLWNDGRHNAWQRENAMLEQERDEALAASQIPSQDPSLRQRARDNDALWDSIRVMDTIDVALLATGVVTLGVGAYLTFKTEHVKLRATSRGRFELGYRF